MPAVSDENSYIQGIIKDTLAFDFISKNTAKEVSAHFISLCSAQNTPNTLNFISEYSPSLYKKLLNAVSEM